MARVGVSPPHPIRDVARVMAVAAAAAAAAVAGVPVSVGATLAASEGRPVTSWHSWGPLPRRRSPPSGTGLAR